MSVVMLHFFVILSLIPGHCATTIPANGESTSRPLVSSDIHSDIYQRTTSEVAKIASEVESVAYEHSTNSTEDKAIRTFPLSSFTTPAKVKKVKQSLAVRKGAAREQLDTPFFRRKQMVKKPIKKVNVAPGLHFLRSDLSHSRVSCASSRGDCRYPLENCFHAKCVNRFCRRDDDCLNFAEERVKNMILWEMPFFVKESFFGECNVHFALPLAFRRRPRLVGGARGVCRWRREKSEDLDDIRGEMRKEIDQIV